MYHFRTTFQIQHTEQNHQYHRFCPINLCFEDGRGVFEKKLPFLEFCSVFVRENRTVLPIHSERKDKKDKMDNSQQR